MKNKIKGEKSQLSVRVKYQESMRDEKDSEILENVKQIPLWVMQTFA